MLGSSKTFVMTKQVSLSRQEQDDMPLPCVIQSRRLEQSVTNNAPSHANLYRSLTCVSSDNREISNSLTKSRENLTSFTPETKEEKCSEEKVPESDYAIMARQRVLKARRLQALEIEKEKREQQEREEKEKRRKIQEEEERKRIEEAKIADEMESKLLPSPEPKSIDFEESDDEIDRAPCPRPKSGHFWRSTLAAGSGVNAVRQVKKN